MPLYHCSLAWLEPGSIIRPGNYGRVLKLFGPQHNHWLREQFLELVRKQEFPDKPSRLTSAFACENLAAAQFFKESSCKTGIVYEVEATDPEAKAHVTDFNCIQPIQGKIEDMYEVAKHYWAASYWLEIPGRPDLRCAERLVECGLRVVAEAT
jgi:hypothetical protein